MKFTDKGEVILTVQRIQDNQYQFSVADTGAGIASCELDKILLCIIKLKIIFTVPQEVASVLRFLKSCAVNARGFNR